MKFWGCDLIFKVTRGKVAMMQCNQSIKTEVSFLGKHITHGNLLTRLTGACNHWVQHSIIFNISYIVLRWTLLCLILSSKTFFANTNIPTMLSGHYYKRKSNQWKCVCDLFSTQILGYQVEDCWNCTHSAAPCMEVSHVLHHNDCVCWQNGEMHIPFQHITAILM